MGSWCRGMPRHQLTDHDPIEFPDLALHNRFGATANALYSSFLAEPRTYGVTLRGQF